MGMHHGYLVADLPWPTLFALLQQRHVSIAPGGDSRAGAGRLAAAPAPLAALRLSPPSSRAAPRRTSDRA